MVSTNFLKIYIAMGFQKFPIYRQRNRKPALKARTENNGGDGFVVDSSSSDHNPNSPIATDNPWVVEHPSALSSFDSMMKAAIGKTIVVFLDYDGTLSPIVDDPDRAFMSDEMRSAVHEVTQNFPTAIISGRSRDKVKKFVKLNDVCYAGSHGMDILIPPRQSKTGSGRVACDKEVIFQPAKKFLPALGEILTLLEEKTKKIQGARVEDNRFCISVHFRQVQDKDHGMLEGIVKSVLQTYTEFRLTYGKKVLEIRPCIDWDKGNALEYLLDTLGFNNNNNNVLPLYIGDDQTDEDAFKVIRRRGQGYPIIVSSNPKETKASYSLSDPSEVLTFLQHLAKWRKNSY